MGLLEKVLGSWNDKEIKRIEKTVEKIESYDKAMQELGNIELRLKTDEFKGRLAKGESLDDILPEAFAVCREASKRVLGMKPFHVQLIGGIVLHEGNIAEMKTGEGKTLVATLPVYLNALAGKGVHVVTVNDYLAKRDAEWMGQLYNFLGLTVGCVIHDIEGDARKAAYQADITYGTNNEFGFDYLRDNMVIFEDRQMQRHLSYAIVDEVDSILIDEARTPLIISGKGDKATDFYYKADRFVKNLKQGEKIEDGDPRFGGTVTFTGDFVVDEKDRQVSLTEEGIARAEDYFGIDNFSDPDNIEINHHVQIALKARYIMHRDVDYIINDGEVVIVDEFTGRLMFGRRFSDGLHQAIEAKEGIKVKSESKTLATITLQNYFRMYDKLAGMTGTAKTEEDEFTEIYNMQVVVIPTNLPVARIDMNDSVYMTQKAKYRAVVEDIAARHNTGQPVLVGTVSVEKSEMLSEMLKKRGIHHEVLNAKQHTREAEIVARAGQLNAVTIATNMAGRGTDIKLGVGVKEVGGLHIIGTERHESRRIDNQLRGRSGRQGDPGSSQFFIALDDDLIRLFGGEKIGMIMSRIGAVEDEPIEASMLSKTIENAQKQVEGRNYGVRKYVLQYDDVMNRQRSIIYEERNKVLHGENLKNHIMNMMREVAIDDADYDLMISQYEEKEKMIGAEKLREIERMLLLRIVDTKWMDHIDAMDQLKTGIGLRSLGHQDPAQAYANDGFDMFEEMLNAIKEDMVKFVLSVSLSTNADRKQVITVFKSSKDDVQSAYNEGGRNVKSVAEEQRGDLHPRDGSKPMPVRVEKKPGRNDPCPCGSGKKYKNCCGKNE